MLNYEDFVMVANKANEDGDMSRFEGTMFESYVDGKKFYIEDISEEDFEALSKVAEHLGIDILDRVDMVCNLSEDITSLLRRFYASVTESYFTDEEVEDQENLWSAVSSGRFSNEESFDTKYMKIILGDFRENITDDMRICKTAMVINSDDEIVFVTQKGDDNES